MTWINKAKLERMDKIVSSARAWVADSSAALNDWASPKDVELVQAVDSFEYPDQSSEGRRCGYDSHNEHTDIERGLFVCDRVPHHAGGHLYGDRSSPTKVRLSA
jgi:hypothetical protein